MGISLFLSAHSRSNASFSPSGNLCRHLSALELEPHQVAREVIGRLAFRGVEAPPSLSSVLFDVQNQRKMSPTCFCSAAATGTSAPRQQVFPRVPTEADISPRFQELSCGVAHVRLQNRKLFVRGVRRDRGGWFSCEVILSHGERDVCLPLKQEPFLAEFSRGSGCITPGLPVS